MLPISGANIVLGFQWLKSLVPVLTDYNTLCMKFFHDDRLVELKGDNESTLNLLTLPQFRRLLKKQGASFYYHIAVISNEVNSDHNRDPLPAIQALITQFNALRGRLTIIFTCFPSLLRWTCDHIGTLITRNAELNSRLSPWYRRASFNPTPVCFHHRYYSLRNKMALGDSVLTTELWTQSLYVIDFQFLPLTNS